MSKAKKKGFLKHLS